MVPFTVTAKILPGVDFKITQKYCTFTFVSFKEALNNNPE